MRCDFVNSHLCFLRTILVRFIDRIVAILSVLGLSFVGIIVVLIIKKRKAK